MQIAHAAEYYDPMPVIRDFRNFAGGPPTTAIAPSTRITLGITIGELGRWHPAALRERLGTPIDS